MNIAIIGYGKMGRAIEKIALENGHQISAKIQKDNWEVFSKVNPKSIDVAIEFSLPEAAFSNISKCLELGIPVISGTTGWLEKLAEVEELCQKMDGTFFYASNYSIGVNVFFKINQMVAKLMENFPDYRPQIEEIHHIHKKDSPSGTAITLAEGIIANNKNIDSWMETNAQVKADKNQLPIKSIREEEVPGTHAIQYTSNADIITVEHKAHSREGFAMGAVLVAAWIIDKKGILNMDDFMS